MLKELIINENQSLSLNEELYSELHKAKLSDQTLPYKIQNNSIIFDDYIVGSIQIGDLIIKIQPRNPAFNLNSFFEMIVYTDFSFLKEDDITGFGFSKDFGVEILIKKFIHQTKMLCKFGLTGNYEHEYVYDDIIYGDINFNSYKKQIIPFYGVESLKSQYTLNVIQNMIIKSALLKCLKNIVDITLRTEIILLLKNFSEIKEYDGLIKQDIENIKNFFSSNKFYPLCIEISLTILQDLKIKYLDSNLIFKSFLFNSNDIFEKYVRTILKRNLNLNVSKLNDNSVTITSTNKLLHSDNEKLEKYLTPDILLNYDENSNRAAAILDVKNKKFNPSSDGNYSDLISSSDLYQMIVYCLSFKTDIAALIYPSEKDFKPISFFTDINETLNIYLFSINMKENLSIRHKKIVSEINQYVVSAL